MRRRAGHEEQHLIDLVPAIPKDPFDRMLVAQAVVEDRLFPTSGRTLARYPGQVLLAQRRQSDAGLIQSAPGESAPSPAA